MLDWLKRLFETKNKPEDGLRLAVDPRAVSASPDEPAFVAKPQNAPVYHGFRVLEDVQVDGFTFGTISDFEAEESDWGDAFVIAPDGSRAGLVWEMSDREFFQQTLPPERERWGVWSVSFKAPMRTREDARRNLASILPQLKHKWEEWKRTYS